LPDFASVNFHEEGAVAVAETLLNRLVGVEAGISNVEAARGFISSDVASQCFRILIEPQEQDFQIALGTISEIETVLHNFGTTAEIVLHGFDKTAWGLLDEAGRRGFGARIGLEDTLTLPDGDLTPDNAALIHEAIRRLPPER
jgi:uncharacterized protein (DUF849 family)